VHPYFDNSLNRLSLVPELGSIGCDHAARVATSTGIEASMRRDIGDNLTVSASYALSRATDDLPGGDVLRSWTKPTHQCRYHVAACSDLGIARDQLAKRLPMTPSPLVPGRSRRRLLCDRPPQSPGGTLFFGDMRLARTIPLRLAICCCG